MDDTAAIFMLLALIYLVGFLHGLAAGVVVLMRDTPRPSHPDILPFPDRNGVHTRPTG